MASALFVWLLGFGGRPIRGAAVGIFSPICVLWIVALAVVIHWAGGAVTTAWMADSLKPFISTGSSLTVILPKRFTKLERKEKRIKRCLIRHTHTPRAIYQQINSIFFFSNFFSISSFQSQILSNPSNLFFFFTSVFFICFQKTKNHFSCPLCCHWGVYNNHNSRIRVNWIFSLWSWHLWQVEQTCSFGKTKKK